MEDTSTNSTPNQSQWYDKTWLVVLLCFLFFPVGLYALWKSSMTSGWKVGITTIVSIYILIVIIDLDSNKNEITKSDSKPTDTTIATPNKTAKAPTINKEAEKNQQLNEHLKTEIASFDKAFDVSNFRNSIENLQMEIVLFNLWATVISEGKYSNDKENQKLSEELKSKVSARQVKEFPKIRQEYCDISASKLWENDIYVSTGGTGNSIINLSGALFAANKNIAETQKTISDILTQFRFKEVRYRWYKEAEEFTYYKLDTPKDGEVILGAN